MQFDFLADFSSQNENWSVIRPGPKAISSITCLPGRDVKQTSQ